MTPIQAFFAVLGILAAILAGAFTIFAAAGGIEKAVKHTLYLAVGMAVGVGGTFALAAMGGAFA